MGFPSKTVTKVLKVWRCLKVKPSQSWNQIHAFSTLVPVFEGKAHFSGIIKVWLAPAFDVLISMSMLKQQDSIQDHSHLMFVNAKCIGQELMALIMPQFHVDKQHHRRYADCGPISQATFPTEEKADLWQKFKNYDGRNKYSATSQRCQKWYKGMPEEKEKRRSWIESISANLIYSWFLPTWSSSSFSDIVQGRRNLFEWLIKKSDQLLD